jgi:hypothetical protein
MHTHRETNDPISKLCVVRERQIHLADTVCKVQDRGKLLMARKWFEKSRSTQIFKTMARITRNVTKPAIARAIIRRRIAKHYAAAHEHLLFRVIGAIALKIRVEK